MEGYLTEETEDETYSRFVADTYTTWDEADKTWDSTGTTIPWDNYGEAGYWEVISKRTLNLGTSRQMELHAKRNIWLTIMDVKFETPHVVMSDVEFRGAAMDLASFKNYSRNISPLGYEESRPLIPGEYTYKKAFIGIQMRVNSLENKLGYYGSTLNVDVEDVVDRGKVEVTSTDPLNPTEVEFSKFYYNPPEEIITNVIAFSDPCMVEIVYKDTKKFQLMLKSLTTGNYVTGTVSWVATGY